MLAMMVWRDSLLAALGRRLTDAAIRLIARERDGQPISTRLVSCVRQSYVDMDVAGDRKRAKLDYYRKHLESALVRETREYYAIRSSELLRLGSVADYVRKALVYFSEEKRRVERYLHATSMEPLMAVCKDVLVVQHLSTLYDEFRACLHADDEDGMAAMFELVRRTDSGLAKMGEMFEEHVLKAGRDAIAACVDDVSSDAGCYVMAILQVGDLLLITTTTTTRLIQPFNGLFSRTTWVSRYQKGKTNLDFTGARDSEWQWRQLGHMQVCT